MNEHNTLNIKIGNVLSIENVSELNATYQIENHFKKIIIDVSKIEKIDTAGLQLILYWKLNAKKKGIDVTWEPDPSDLFIEKTRKGGFVDALDLYDGE